ncbi:MAG: hypothetical protein CFE24_03685 [Flavobacterium sp. BFFFF2]|nr:MAG: hypothetical protein CFE24_03685 [Flavobacterium sp. BFFFF2]
MDSYKILITSNGFYPDISPRSFRATELAKELVRQGHQVTVVTHLRGDVEAFCQQHGITYKNLGDLTWKQFKLPTNRVAQLAARLANRLGLMLFEFPMIQLWGLTKRALKNETSYDALISVAVPYPTHWGVASIWSKKIAKKWIADCGDPYMGQENDTFKPAFYFGWIEKWFCKKADFITVPTEKAVLGYYPEFRSKIHIIPQGFKFSDVKTFQGELPRDKVTFGYGGMFIPGKRDPSEFLNYLNSLDASINFEFQIYTNTPQFVQPFIEASKGRIKLMPIVNRETLLYNLSGMHFVVNFENEGSTQTPSKLIDYAIINKPILSVKFGQLNTQVVDDFFAGNYTYSLQTPPVDQYRIEKVTEQFLALIK